MSAGFKCASSEKLYFREDNRRSTPMIQAVTFPRDSSSNKTSAVDGKPLDGVRSMKVQQDTEFESDGRSIRCTEVFHQLKSPDSNLASVVSSCNAFQKDIALATCSALTPHLTVLMTSGINSLSLRVSTQADMVEYQAGSGGRLLPQRYMNELDSALIPVIHGGGASVPQTAMDMEFVFYITYTI